MTNSELALARLDWPEGPLVEKKSAKDQGDWPKTLVAFANSTSETDKAILYIGASNQPPHKGVGSPNDVDDIQRRISDMALSKCYPPIIIEIIPLIIKQKETDCHLVAVIVQGSAARPHFAGGAYLRDGSKSRPANKETYADLIASHNETARKLLPWKKQQIQWKLVGTNGIYYLGNATVMNFGGTSITIQDDNTGSGWPIPVSDISYLDRGSLRPVIQVKYWASDRELIEYLLSRWCIWMATMEPLYHAQVAYIQKQAEMHPELFEPVVAYMRSKGDNSKFLADLHTFLLNGLVAGRAVLKSKR